MADNRSSHFLVPDTQLASPLPPEPPSSCPPLQKTRFLACPLLCLKVRPHVYLSHSFVRSFLKCYHVHEVSSTQPVKNMPSCSLSQQPNQPPSSYSMSFSPRIPHWLTPCTLLLVYYLSPLTTISLPEAGDFVPLAAGCILSP